MFKKKLKAFTLTEILVALSIMVVLISFSVYGVNIAKRQGRELERTKIIANIKAAVETIGSTYGSYPSNLKIHYINSGKFQVCNETGAKCKDISISSQDFLAPYEVDPNAKALTNPVSTTTTTVYCYNYYPQVGKYVLGFKTESGSWKEYGNYDAGNCGSLSGSALSDSFITHLDVEQVTIAPSLTAKPPSQLVYQATNPSPADRTTNVSMTPTLSWTAGNGAKEHEVYFGTTNPPIKITTQTEATYTPGTLASLTTYYWRITEKNGSTKATGTVWSFTTGVPVSPATNVYPSNGSTAVTVLPTLNWTAGNGAISHDVYFGTTNPPPFIGNQTQTTYTPKTSLLTNTRYYWKIDEKGTSGIAQGTVWSFQTVLSWCGDNKCEIKESFLTCPTDCHCGNASCEANYNENLSTCPTDCTCGNNYCDSRETYASCPNDCHCGNSSCEPTYGETLSTCPTDCKCGNGVCDYSYGESNDNCPNDCCKLVFRCVEREKRRCVSKDWVCE